MKFGIMVERGQKQQNFQNLEAGQLWFGVDNDEGTGNSGADMLVGRVGQFNQGTARTGNPAPGAPFGEFRYWNIDAFAQDSWKVRSNLTLEYGVRFGYWTNNEELGGLGGYFTPDLYDPTKGSFLDPGTYQRVNGVCYVETGCAPAGILGEPRSRSRCRASTWPGTSTAKATTCSAAATASSTTATWATSNTTTACGWRRTPTRSPRTSGPAATTGTASA